MNEAHKGAYLPGCRVNKHPFTRQSGNLPSSHANNIYFPGSDKLTEVYLYSQLHVN